MQITVLLELTLLALNIGYSEAMSPGTTGLLEDLSRPMSPVYSEEGIRETQHLACFSTCKTWQEKAIWGIVMLHISVD